MSIYFENDRMVPVSKMGRLRSNGSCEKKSAHADRVEFLGGHPIAHDGVMLSGQNIQAYLQAKAKEDRIARWHKIFGDKKETVAPATIIPFKRG